jgi:hypothetical protein
MYPSPQSTVHGIIKRIKPHAFKCNQLDIHSCLSVCDRFGLSLLALNTTCLRARDSIIWHFVSPKLWLLLLRVRLVSQRSTCNSSNCLGVIVRAVVRPEGVVEVLSKVRTDIWNVDTRLTDETACTPLVVR